MTSVPGAYERITRASAECKSLIQKYYGIRGPDYETDALARALEAAHIPCERVVKRHAHLLDADWAMQQESKELLADIETLSDQLARDEQREQLLSLMRCNARLRIYEWRYCTACHVDHGRVDVSVVRVWAKSARFQVRVDGHAPQRVRLHMNPYLLTVKHVDSFGVRLTADALRDATNVASEFEQAVHDALYIPSVLVDLVIAYSGVQLFRMNGSCGLDTE